MKKEYTVYMVRCGDSSLYIGMTSDVPQRIDQHNHGVFEGAYTAKRAPVALVYSATFEDVYDAIAWERKIKKWSRKKKEALVSGDWDTIQYLSKRHHSHSAFSKIKGEVRYKIQKQSVIFRDEFAVSS